MTNASNNTIRSLALGGTVTNYAGVPHTGVTPTGEAGSTDGTGAAARFSVPRGLALPVPHK